MGAVGGGPGFKVAERVLSYIERHRMLTRAAAVVVGVSGGPDSTCLLHVLSRLNLDLTLVVAHVDHGLSSASSEVAAKVARDAAEAGFDVHVARAGALAGPNLQERARDFRYQFFNQIAQQSDARVIATGHTLDDRVETTLARLVHGAAPETLAGIRPQAGNRIHPLLELRRSETRAYCEEIGASFFEDPGNEDPRYERTAIRTKVVPAIEERWGDGGVRSIAVAIERLTEDADALGAQAETLFQGIGVWNDQGGYAVDLKTLLALPRSLRRRVLELAVGRVRDRSGGISQALDALDRPERKTGARFALAEGGEIVIAAAELVVVPPPSAAPKND